MKNSSIARGTFLLKQMEELAPANNQVDKLSIQFVGRVEESVGQEEVKQLLQELLRVAANTSDELRKVEPGKKRDHIRSLFQDVAISVDDASEDKLIATIEAQPRMTPRQMSSAAPRSILKNLFSALQKTNQIVLGDTGELVHEVVESGLSLRFCQTFNLLISRLDSVAVEFNFDWAKDVSGPTANVSFSAIWLNLFQEVLDRHDDSLSSKAETAFKAEVARRLKAASEPVLSYVESHTQNAENIEERRYYHLSQRAQSLVFFFGAVAIALLVFGSGPLQQLKQGSTPSIVFGLVSLSTWIASVACLFGAVSVYWAQKYKNQGFDSLLSMHAMAQEELRENHTAESVVFRRACMTEAMGCLQEKRQVNDVLSLFINISQGLSILFAAMMMFAVLYLLS